jgi:hypothetical protein
MGQSTIRYFKEIPSQTSTITAIFVSLEESIPSVSANVSAISGQGSNNPPDMTYFCVVPDEVLEKPAGYQWAVTFERSDNVTLSTDIFTVPGEHAELDDKLADIQNRLKIMEIKNQLLRDMIDGRTESIDENTIFVYNKDDVIIQKLSVVNGIRTPQFDDVIIDYVDGEPELAITATLAQDDQGNDYWIKELTQEGDV